MNALVYERVHDNLKRLKLTTIDEYLDNYLEIAAEEERSTLEVLDHLLDQEVKSKEDRAREFRMRLAGFRWGSGSRISTPNSSPIREYAEVELLGDSPHLFWHLGHPSLLLVDHCIHL
ncbi:ATP-binding protein [Methanoculleus frigidifontis]|uniref:ATP-binding protein n=1 Tax=Methanoculleus frigidifontis TaxID=2584085 RepID=UPI003464CED8